MRIRLLFVRERLNARCRGVVGFVVLLRCLQIGMLRVLVIGMNPDSVDFSDPGMPRGLNAEEVRGEIEPELQHLRDQGWDTEHCTIEPDANAGPTVERCLASARYDCIVIGAGVRLPVHRLQVFEAVINAVHQAAPAARITFNTSLNDSAHAVARWLHKP